MCDDVWGKSTCMVVRWIIEEDGSVLWVSKILDINHEGQTVSIRVYEVNPEVWTMVFSSIWVEDLCLEGVVLKENMRELMKLSHMHKEEESYVPKHTQV